MKSSIHFLIVTCINTIPRRSQFVQCEVNWACLLYFRVFAAEKLQEIRAYRCASYLVRTIEKRVVIGYGIKHDLFSWYRLKDVC